MRLPRPALVALAVAFVSTPVASGQTAGVTVKTDDGGAPAIRLVFRNQAVAGTAPIEVVKARLQFETTAGIEGYLNLPRTASTTEADLWYSGGNVLYRDATTTRTLVHSGNAFVQNGNSFGTLATLGTNDAFMLQLETNGTGRILIDATGDVYVQNATSGVSVGETLVGFGHARLWHDNDTGAAGAPRSFLGFHPRNNADTGTTNLANVIMGKKAASDDSFIAFETRSGVTLAERVRIDSNGRVGIGTANPAASLTVGAAGQFQVDAAQGDVTFTNVDGSITFPATAGANSPMVHLFASGTSNADRMVFAHSPAFPTWGLQYADSSDLFHFLRAGTAVLTVDLGNQRVGVGQSAPETALHVGNGGDPILKIDGAVNTVGGGPRLRFTEVFASDYGIELFLETNSDVLVFRNLDGGTVNLDDIFTIKRLTGQIGIGTRTPTEHVEIVGSGKNLQISNTSETDAGIVFTDDQAETTQRYRILFNSSNNNLNFYDSNDLQARFRQDNSAQNDNGWATAAIDYAEFLPKLDPAEAIDVYEVVAVRGGRITKDTTGATFVLVTSTDSGIRGGSPIVEGRSREEDPDWLAVAFLGQMPVLVEGPVREGDYVVPSGRGDGRARAVSPDRITRAEFAQVCGRALDGSADPLYHRTSPDPDPGSEISQALERLRARRGPACVINVAVGLPAGLPSFAEDQARLEALEARLESLERRAAE